MILVATTLNVKVMNVKDKTLSIKDYLHEIKIYLSDIQGVSKKMIPF